MTDPVIRWAIEPSTAVLAGIDSPLAALPAEQRARADRLRQARDRDDFIAARLLTQRLVAQVTGRPAPFTQSCDHCGGPHGRPVVDSAELHLSWSHAGGWVAAVVSDQPCGIDVEPVNDRPPLFDVLSAEEQQAIRSLPESQQPNAFLRLWVRKEALAKAAGTGLTDQTALAQLDVRADDVTYADQHWHLTDLDALDGVVAAIVRRGVEPSAPFPVPSRLS